MFLGFSAFTWLHTLLSLIAIVAGIAVLVGMFQSRTPRAAAALFLATAIATSATGFGFQVSSFGASHYIGALSLVVLAVAAFALYGARLAGAWRPIYVVTSMIALYFLVFVLIAQAFKKVPALAALAPTLSESPFAIAQAANLALFVVLALLALWRYRPIAAA